MSGGDQDPGALFTIFDEYKSEIESVFIFVTPPSPLVDYSEIAQQNQVKAKS